MSSSTGPARALTDVGHSADLAAEGQMGVGSAPMGVRGNGAQTESTVGTTLVEGLWWGKWYGKDKAI